MDTVMARIWIWSWLR